MTKMFLLNRSITLGEMDYKCCFAPGEPPGVKFSIPETPVVKVGSGIGFPAVTTSLNRSIYFIQKFSISINC